MKTKLLLLTLAAILLLPIFAYTQENSLKDTVWVRRTDQLYGFYMVKFSNTDKYIVGMGNEVSIFFDSETGQELKRIPFNSEVIFLNNDTQFMQIAPSEDKIYIYDFESLHVIDSIENNGEIIGDPDATGGKVIWVNNNESILLGLIEGGFRIWDLKTKEILKTHYYEDEKDLISRRFTRISLNCNMTRILIKQEKTYKTENPFPYDKRIDYYNVFYDYNTLNEVYRTPNRYFFYEMSSTCKYIAYESGLDDNSNFGVLIHDPNTHELITKIPVNGPSLSGIEFTSDDRYMVTSNGPGLNKIIVWSSDTWEIVYEYYYFSTHCFDIDHQDKYIISDVAGDLVKWHFRTEPNSINEDKPDVIEISPNPVESILFLNNLTSDTYQISLISINGNDLGLLYDGYINDTIRLDVSKYPSGAYILNIESETKTFNQKFTIIR
jgi:hypothetical protein